MEQENKKEILTSKAFLFALSFLGLFFLSTGISWAIFSYVVKSPGTLTVVSDSELASARSKISELPKTEECPINGGMFTKPEKEIWQGRRPIAAVIENHEEARPQSGLSAADVVYEAVAEGGITRFLSIFYCGAAGGDVLVSPVRSARIYFVNLAAGYGDRPIFTHVGGANRLCSNCPGGLKPRSQVDPIVDAVSELSDLEWRIPGGNDFDTTYDAGFPVFWRNYERLDHPVATEHTMTSSTDKIYEEAKERGFTDKKDGESWDKNWSPWTFADEKPSSSPEVKEISFEFWTNQSAYNVSWKYDSSSNGYLRSVGGKPHTDLEFDNRQIVAKNVAIVFVKEKGPVDSEKHMYYEVVGTGKAVVFQNGSVIKGTWTKDTQSDMVRFYDEDKAEVKMVRGTTWVELVPNGNEIKY